MTVVFLSGMEDEGELTGSVELNHLTEEEQTAILQVLQRDLELRRRDEGRVRSEVITYNQH